MEKEEVLKVEQLSKVFELSQKGPVLFKDILKKGLKGFKRPQNHFEKPLWSLKEVSFSVKKGETVGIIGRNGAGKSTLLKIISGLMSPTSGRVVLHQPVASILEIGSGFHPELSGKENIFFNGQLMGYSKKEIESRYQRIVDFSEIESFMDTPVKYYSSGMFLRLAFSIAVHFERELMVFDEVLAVGDQRFQNKCMSKITELKNKNCTFLIVSHNFREVANLCDRIIWLKNGELYRDGKTYQVLTDYIKEEEAHEKKLKEESAEDLAAPNTQIFKEEIEEALQESHLKVHRLKVYQETPNEQSGFYRHQAIQFELHFSVLRHAEVFNLAFVLRDALKTPLFGGGTFEYFHQQAPTQNQMYQLRWTIPANLLGAGFFKISLVEFLDNNRSFANYDFYEFEVRDLHTKEGWNPRFFTPINPPLNIEVSPLDNEVV